MKNKILDKIKEIQKDEITGYNIYNRLAKIEKEKNNSGILEKIAADELVHYTF
jgi:rubrerythrin